jgi:hypothetical protein
MAKLNNLGSLEGRSAQLHGLMLAARKAQAEEKIKKEQQQAFDKKSEDVKKTQ